jgi:hypothetical protein
MSGPTMTLHSFVWPHVRPGTYRVDTRQEMSGAGLGSADTLPARTHHVEVTAPRFSMPGNEVFGVFPPPNASGPFVGRLAQIVLRSRSLPWDRATSSAQPWLALVVLAEGEANFLPDVVATAAYTAGRAPAGIPADARCAALEVPKLVIDNAFPAAGELELLTHVRQVDPSETEYADSDGWVSVVIANRVPQPGQAYGAYLISIEGQIDKLPAAGTVAPEAGGVSVFDDIFTNIGDLVIELPRFTDRVPVIPRPNPRINPRVASRTNGASGSFGRNDARGTTNGAAFGPTIRSSSARLVRHDIDFSAFPDLFDIDPVFVTTSRFPVLAHWEFACSDEPKDFAGHMVNLDVGLLGTAPIVDPRAPVVPVAATGHVSIAHTDRRGDAGRAWYRGPFTPTKITREAAGRPYHVADQARRIGTDGREDISYAAAFEVGRLLAMSDLQYLRALRQWVREEFVVRRRHDILAPHLEDLGIALPFDPGLSRLISRDILVPGGFGGDPRVQLGTPLPIHEAEGLFRPTDPEVLAAGFDLEVAFVASVLGTDLVTEPVGPGVLDHGLNTFDEVLGSISSLESLSGELVRFVDEIDQLATNIVLDRKAGVGGPLIDRLGGGPS